MFGFDDKYFEYSNDVLEGRIVACEAIKLACNRYHEFFKRDDIEFRPDAADRVVRFIEKIRHFKGKHAGKLFLLQPWQKWCIYSIFGFYYKGTNERVTKKVLLTIARKNGKSAFAAAIALYLLAAEQVDGTQVLNVANNRTQAHLLFDMEVNFLQSLDPNGKYFRYLRDSIKYDKRKSYAKVLSSDAKKHDGFGCHFICDESHEYRDSRLWDVLIGGQGDLESPIAMNISTYGFNVNGWLYEYVKISKDVLRGLKTDDEQFSAIYELDEGDDWKDESVWRKANPNLDITTTTRFIRSQVNAAINNSVLEYNVRTKLMNQWVQSKEVWIPDRYVDSHLVDVDWEDLRGELCYAGVDLSAVSDLTSWTLMFPPNEDRKVYPDKYIFKTVMYVPESTYEENVNGDLYKKWCKEGHIKCITGNSIDYDHILKDQLSIVQGYELRLEKMAYDEWNARQWAINAEAEGLPLVIYSQTLGSFNIPTKAFEMLLRQDKVVIDKNSVVRFCFQNCELKFDHHDNCKPSRAGGDKHKKIDAVISMLESLGVYLSDPNIANDIIFLSNG